MTAQDAAGQVKLIPVRSVTGKDNFPTEMEATKLVLSAMAVEKQNARDAMALAKISQQILQIY